jgi:hypothetical protein
LYDLPFSNKFFKMTFSNRREEQNDVAWRKRKFREQGQEGVLIPLDSLGGSCEAQQNPPKSQSPVAVIVNVSSQKEGIAKLSAGRSFKAWYMPLPSLGPFLSLNIFCEESSQVPICTILDLIEE